MKTDVERLLFDFDSEKKFNFRKVNQKIFFIIKTKSSLSTSVFIFSTISQNLQTNFHVRGLSGKYRAYHYIFAPWCSSDLCEARTSTVKPHKPIGCLLTSPERIVHAQRVFVYKAIFEFGGFCDC